MISRQSDERTWQPVPKNCAQKLDAADWFNCNNTHANMTSPCNLSHLLHQEVGCEEAFGSKEVSLSLSRPSSARRQMYFDTTMFTSSIICSEPAPRAAEASVPPVPSA